MKRKKYKTEHQVKEVRISILQYCIHLTISKNKKFSKTAVFFQDSVPVRVTDLVAVSKDTASLVVCTRKNFFVGVRGIFVSDIISGGLFRHLGQLHLALGLNR